MSSIGFCVLAAGKGTRLNLDIPKVILPILGKPMIEYTINEINKIKSPKDEIGVVVGHGRDQVKDAISQYECTICFQKEQLGTANAVESYFSGSSTLSGHDYTFVMCGDTPLISSEELESLKKEALGQDLDVVVATVKLSDPFGYGRIIRTEDRIKIVEHKDATEKERELQEINTALYLFKTSFLKESLNNISNDNASGEFYLTDILEMTTKSKAVEFKAFSTFLGVNTLVQASEIESLLLKRIIEKHLLSGVRILRPETQYIESSVDISSGSVIYPNCTLLGKTKIGANSIVESGSVLKDSELENDVQILSQSRLEQCYIKSHASIGPFARIRPKSIIGSHNKIGNFVETKNIKTEDGVKISHLSYVGDAEIGARTNIGCGFVTCNYDGANKHKSVIGSDCFIGSDSQLIAPITLGDRVYIGSGSTINQDIPTDAFAIARSRQVTKEGLSKKFIKTKKNKA